MELFKDHCSNHTANAQRNLMGRTHYVDPGTLKWHKSRVLSSRVHDKGLLFSIVTSDALDMENTKRGYRFVIFDLFGTVLARPDLKNAARTREQATKWMYAALNDIDAVEHTFQAADKAQERYAAEIKELKDNAAAIFKAKHAA